MLGSFPNTSQHADTLLVPGTDHGEEDKTASSKHIDFNSQNRPRPQNAPAQATPPAKSAHTSSAHSFASRRPFRPTSHLGAENFTGCAAAMAFCNA